MPDVASLAGGKQDAVRVIAENATMAQLLVRNLESDVVERLRGKAKASGTSLEEFARQTLREAAKPSRAEIIAEVDRIRALNKGSSFDSTAELRRLRDGDDVGH